MTVSEAALADIVANQADDAPRLIYADWLKEHDAWTWDTVLGHVLHHPQADGPRLLAAHWLDEHDDPERAEFIRVQCDRAGMDPYHLSCTGDKCGLSECNRLRRRQRELLEAHRLSWAWPLPDLLGVMEFDGRTSDLPWKFRRGFVEEVSLTTEDFLRHARDLFRVAPLLRVTLSDREPSEPWSTESAWVWCSRRLPHSRLQEPSDLPLDLFDLLPDTKSHDSWRWARRVFGSREEALSALHAAALLWGRRQGWPCPQCCRDNILTEQGDEDCPACSGTGHDVTT